MHLNTKNKDRSHVIGQRGSIRTMRHTRHRESIQRLTAQHGQLPVEKLAEKGRNQEAHYIPHGKTQYFVFFQLKTSKLQDVKACQVTIFIRANLVYLYRFYNIHKEQLYQQQKIKFYSSIKKQGHFEFTKKKPNGLND